MSQNVPFDPVPPETSELTPAQRVAAAVLASGDTTHRAASFARVNRRTITRWRSEPAFAKEIDRLTSIYADDVAAKLQLAARRAAECLANAVADDPKLALRLLTSFPHLAEREPGKSGMELRVEDRYFAMLASED
ncbi:MAG: hypothetical protein AAF732_21085 [Pseudomonadota bacterium]